MSSKEDLTYEWLPNLSQYEAKIMLGLTSQEAMGAAMGFIVPVSIVPSIYGVVVAILTTIIVLLSIKKIDRFGQKPFLIYLIIRLWERIRQKEVEIPLIMGGNTSSIEIENWDGETIMTLDDLGV